MTDDSDFKKLVRERMARTGESYTTARSHVLRKGPHRDEDSVGGAPGGGRAGPEAYAMGDGTALAASKDRLKSTLDAAIGDATLELLDGTLHVDLAGFEAHVPYERISAITPVPDMRPGASLGAHGIRGKWLVNVEYTGLVRIDIDPPIRAQLHLGATIGRLQSGDNGFEPPRLLKPFLRTWRPKLRQLTISVRDRDPFLDDLRARVTMRATA